MNTYKIGGRVVKGINLMSALESLNITGIQIIPLWRDRSNGKYKVYCNETAIILCEWIEKVNSL